MCIRAPCWSVTKLPAPSATQQTLMKPRSSTSRCSHGTTQKESGRTDTPTAYYSRWFGNATADPTTDFHTCDRIDAVSAPAAIDVTFVRRRRAAGVRDLLLNLVKADLTARY